MLRHTCDACTNSKVKCDGNLPCSRCLRRNDVCNYRPKQKKSKRTLDQVNAAIISGTEQGVISSEPVVSETEAFRNFTIKQQTLSLDLHERRTWNVFFSLYKSFGKSCSSMWFSKQLQKMIKFLEYSRNESALRNLRSWMKAMDISERDVNNIEGCSFHVNLHLKEFDGAEQEVLTPVSDLLQLEGEANDHELPYLVIKEDGTIYTNDHFNTYFGIDSADLTGVMMKSGGFGFLPWGGDIISRLVEKESDVLAFIQILAIKYNLLGKPKSIPAFREVPCVNIFDVSISNGISEKCLIKSLHREKLEATGVHKSSVFFSFTPMPEPSVYVPDKRFRKAELELSEADSENLSRDQQLFDKNGMESKDEIPESMKEMTMNLFSTLPEEVKGQTLADDDIWLDFLTDWASEVPDAMVDVEVK